MLCHRRRVRCSPQARWSGPVPVIRSTIVTDRIRPTYPDVVVIIIVIIVIIIDKALVIITTTTILTTSIILTSSPSASALVQIALCKFSFSRRASRLSSEARASRYLGYIFMIISSSRMINTKANVLHH